MEGHSKPTAAHFVPLAWPMVSLLSVFLFIGPLTRLADGLSYRAQEVVSIKLGKLEIHYNKSDLPVPNSAVAAALGSGITEQELLTLLEYDLPEGDANTSGGPCFLEGDERLSVYEKLKEEELINFIEKPAENAWCEDPYAVSLTLLGLSVKEYLVYFISVQINSASR